MDIGRLLVALPRKIGPQSRLLFRDPKRFIENLDDLIHPERLQQKMLGLEEMRPMHVRIDGGNTATPHLNVLLTGLGGRLSRLSGGWNTAINIAIRMAEAGIPVRLLVTDDGVPADINALWLTISSITGQAAGAAKHHLWVDRRPGQSGSARRATCSWRPDGSGAAYLFSVMWTASCLLITVSKPHTRSLSAWA